MSKIFLRIVVGLDARNMKSHPPGSTPGKDSLIYSKKDARTVSIEVLTN